jgi:phenylalanyl-tRNA synthetase beta chain
MKISEQWLREWIPLTLGTEALAERLTMAGLEVGAIAPVAADIQQVVVGEILSAAPHPQADRLRVCRVGVGKRRVLDIVCGAANAAAGLKVPVALVGAILPNGTEIKQAAIRGVESSGMLCSAAELGLAESAEGLLVLPREAEPGLALSVLLQLDDNQLEIDLTPNRGDCLSIAGVARELSALTKVKVRRPVIKPASVKSKVRRKVTLKAAKDCPRYVGRVIEGIDAFAATPLWMTERLRRSGLRSIHPVVDVTNYVMLELGQPMHAFDLDKLSGDIQVRPARQGERLALLDGSTATLEAGSVLIADAKGPLALAGVMGGMDSAVSAATTQVFLESAYFRAEAISLRARRLGLHTDSSHRFERGVDPTLQRTALERATALILAITGGRAGPITEQKVAAGIPRPPSIVLRRTQISRLLGAKIADKAVGAILQGLGMRTVRSAAGWRVTPPAWRSDVRRECDLIEEVARVTGYENLPQLRPSMTLRMGAAAEGWIEEDRFRQILIDRDYQEAITYSFIDPGLQGLLYPDVKAITLTNPIAADMAAMRTSLWPGLLKAVLHNQNRQQTRIRLFEIGRRFVSVEGGVREDPMLAGVVTGAHLVKQWGVPERPVDFYDVKGDVEALLAVSGYRDQLRFKPVTHSVLHSGQAAEILGPNGQSWGLIGTLHPEIQAKLGLDRPVVVFELPLTVLSAAKIPVFSEISRYPAIRRDLSLIVAEHVPAQAILDSIALVIGNLLVNLELFDEYRGEGIDSGRKSLTLGLTLQHSSRTLKEEEIEAVMTQVVSTLRSDWGAQLRQ